MIKILVLLLSFTTIANAAIFPIVVTHHSRYSYDYDRHNYDDFYVNDRFIKCYDISNYASYPTVSNRSVVDVCLEAVDVICSNYPYKDGRVVTADMAAAMEKYDLQPNVNMVNKFCAEKVKKMK